VKIQQFHRHGAAGIGDDPIQPRVLLLVKVLQNLPPRLRRQTRQQGLGLLGGNVGVGAGALAIDNDPFLGRGHRIKMRGIDEPEFGGIGGCFHSID